MDHYQCLQMKCSDNAILLRNFVEKEMIFEFLAGLNSEFDQVRVQVLGKEKLPLLNEFNSMIRAEESRRGVMLEPTIADNSTMVSKGIVQKQTSLEPQLAISMEQCDVLKTGNKNTIWCTYYKKPRHTRERCWKLNGKPFSTRRMGTKEVDNKRSGKQI
ncbi:hypothetical protein ACOSQ2_029656 [Xanthoceras sorbifolium]